MVEGRLRKEFYAAGRCCCEQTFLGAAATARAPSSRSLKDAEKARSARPIKVAKFVRYALGEGIEKKEDDFAAEVASAAGATS